MYAIFETGGKQYKVQAGDVLRIEKIQGNDGDLIKFGNVIAFSDGEGALETGTPYLDAATVNATILSVGKGKKVIIFKFKSKKDFRKKQGHRQPYTEIEIENFTIGGKTVGKKPEKPVEPEPKKEEAPAEEEVKEKKPAKAKAPKKEKPETAVADEPVDETPVVEATVEEAPVVEEVKEDKPAAKEKAPAKETKEEAKEATVDYSKLTKADIMAKLDELGVKYLKSAKKDELIALIDAESK